MRQIRHLRVVVIVGLVAAGALLLWSAPASAKLTRGPFLQNVQQDRITICWETEEPSTADLLIKDDKGSTVQTILTAAPATHHEVVVDGLVAGQKYQYEVELSGLFGKPVGGTFTTAPPPGSPIEFVAWGDSRSGTEVCRKIANRILATGVPFSVHSGDIVGRGDSLKEWNKMLFGPCRRLLRSTVFWPVLGNHDLGRNPDVPRHKPYTDAFALPNNEIWYSFDYGDAHFLMLNSLNSGSKKQYEFAVRDLESTTAPWRFVVWHEPVFNSGGHGDNISMRTRYCPLLAKHNVDMIIMGHDHNYQLTKPIKHHYEPAQKHPYWHLVAGGGGANTYPVHNNKIWSDKGGSFHGFVHISIDGDRLSAKVIDIDGKVVDTFEIDKSKPAPEAVAYELIELLRRYEELVAVDTEGKAVKAISVSPEQTSGTLHYALPNPLPEPITVKFPPPKSEGLTFEGQSKEITIAAKTTGSADWAFRVTSLEKVYPLISSEIEITSPVGPLELRAPVPPIAVSREVMAGLTDAEFNIDGQAEEAAWKKAPEMGRLVSKNRHNLRYQGAQQATEIRALHDNNNLYLLVVSKRLERRAPYIGKSLRRSDHLYIYLAGADAKLLYWIDALGLTEHQGEIGAEVKSSCRATDGKVTWEMAIPLGKFHKAGAVGQEPLVLNIFEQNRRIPYYLVPTFGQASSKENSACLKFEQSASTKPQSASMKPQ